MMKKLLFYARTDSGEQFDFQIDPSSGSFVLSHEVFAKAKNLTVFCDHFSAEAGEKGYYLIPGSRGKHGSALTWFRQREDSEFLVKSQMMSSFAVGKTEAVYLVMVDWCYRYEYRVGCENNHYHIALYFDFTIQPPSDDIRLTVFPLDADTDYNGVAKAIRDIRLAKGEIHTLKEKCAKRPPLDYFRRYPLIRIRMAWKPVPPTVLHQTLKNEPPVHVACDFARVRDIADELKRQGVEGAELSLVGWNQKGHDGRWPQFFPVEEALGGEEELKKTISYVQSLGYHITCHTNSLDHYEIADIFDREKLVVDSEGKYVSAGQWSGGLGYHACPTHQLELTKQSLPAVAALGFSGIHYIDVLSVLMPDACYHKAHPSSTRQGMEKMKKILRFATERFGGCSSEGCLDYLLDELDFSLYNRFATFDVESEYPFVDAFVPLWELTYHGIMLYNPCTSTVNDVLKSPDETVTARLLDGKPTYYYYSKFCGTGHDNWMGEIDLTCDTQEELEQSVRAIKKGYDDYIRICDRQFIYMKSFEFPLKKFYVVTYENGDCIMGNYNNENIEYNGVVVPPHSYVQLLK